MTFRLAASSADSAVTSISALNVSPSADCTVSRPKPSAAASNGSIADNTSAAAAKAFKLEGEHKLAARLIRGFKASPKYKLRASARRYEAPLNWTVFGRADQGTHRGNYNNIRQIR